MSKLQRLSYVAIDQIAQKELLAYLGSQDKLRAAEPVNIWHYAEIYKGYGMEYAAVSADHKTLALSVFDDSVIEVWDDDEDEPRPFPVEAGTIVFDEVAHRDGPAGRARFTLAHECGHMLLHKDTDLDMAALHEDEHANEDLRWFEWQADSFASCFLMPKPAVTKLFYQLKRDHKVNVRLRDEVESLVAVMAETFQTSHQAMWIRLAKLDLVPSDREFLIKEFEAL